MGTPGCSTMRSATSEAPHYTVILSSVQEEWVTLPCLPSAHPSAVSVEVHLSVAGEAHVKFPPWAVSTSTVTKVNSHLVPELLGGNCKVSVNCSQHCSAVGTFST